MQQRFNFNVAIFSFKSMLDSSYNLSLSLSLSLSPVIKRQTLFAIRTVTMNKIFQLLVG